MLIDIISILRHILYGIGQDILSQSRIKLIDIVELEVRSEGPTQDSQTGHKTFLPLGEMDLEQTLKLVLHPTPPPPHPTMKLLRAEMDTRAYSKTFLLRGNFFITQAFKRYSQISYPNPT